ncbi:MAG: phosphoenolpyruvate carboxylase, partial [Planctomycetia bacterium]
MADDLLRRDVRFLADMLGAVIRESEGDAAVALVEEIRGLSRDRRAGRHESEPALAARIEALDEGQARLVTRALSGFFELVNCAEGR